MPSLEGRSFKDFALITGNFVWGRGGRSISAARCHFLFTRRREGAKIFGSRRDADGAERGRNIGPLRPKKCRVLGWDNHAFRCTRPRIINVAKRPVSANNLCWVASIFAASRHLILLESGHSRPFYTPPLRAALRANGESNSRSQISAPSAPPREPKIFASSRLRVNPENSALPRLRANLFPHSHEAHRATTAPIITLPPSSTSAPHPAFKLSRFTLYPSTPYRPQQSH